MLTLEQATTPTLMEQHARLLSDLRQALAQHPCAASFHVVFAPESLDISRNNVLVQTVNPDRGVLELQPRKVSNLTPADTLHTTQIVDPRTAVLPSLASQPGTWCDRYVNDQGRTVHSYYFED